MDRTAAMDQAPVTSSMQRPAANPRSTMEQLQLAGALWWRGVWEALQLQRCVVLIVLDDAGVIWARIRSCFLTNGCVYLGSLLVNHYLVQPGVAWLLERWAAPAYGPAGVAGLRRGLDLLLQLAWLLPVYVLSLAVSCLWYQQLAVAACTVSKQRKQQQQQLSSSSSSTATGGAAGAASVLAAASQQQPWGPATPPQPSSGSSSSRGLPPAVAGSGSAGEALRGSPRPAAAGLAGVLEAVAEEVFRVALFLVATLEVLALAQLPYIGRLLNVALLSWLYAYYCFDYKWAWQRTQLTDRLAAVEQRWAFFGGFGFPCVILTVLLPFHWGAAACNLLFPVFVLVACECEPLPRPGDVAGGAGVLPQLPIFSAAVAPTTRLTALLFRTARARGGGSAGHAKRL